MFDVAGAYQSPCFAVVSRIDPVYLDLAFLEDQKTVVAGCGGSYRPGFAVPVACVASSFAAAVVGSFLPRLADTVRPDCPSYSWA